MFWLELVLIVKASPATLVVFVDWNPLNCNLTPFIPAYTSWWPVPNPIFSPTLASPGLDANVLTTIIDLDAILYCNCIPAPATKLKVSFGFSETTRPLSRVDQLPGAAVELTLIFPKLFAPCILILPEPMPPIISHCEVSNTPWVVLTLDLHQANTWSSPVVAGSSTITGW